MRERDPDGDKEDLEKNPSNLFWEPVGVGMLVGRELTLLSTTWARRS